MARDLGSTALKAVGCWCGLLWGNGCALLALRWARRRTRSLSPAATSDSTSPQWRLHRTVLPTDDEEEEEPVVVEEEEGFR